MEDFCTHRANNSYLAGNTLRPPWKSLCVTVIGRMIHRLVIRQLVATKDVRIARSSQEGGGAGWCHTCWGTRYHSVILHFAGNCTHIVFSTACAQGGTIFGVLLPMKHRKPMVWSSFSLLFYVLLTFTYCFLVPPILVSHYFYYTCYFPSINLSQWSCAGSSVVGVDHSDDTQTHIDTCG